MSPSRRDALAQLGTLIAAPLLHGAAGSLAEDPLAGTIAQYQAGRARGAWSATTVTEQALDRAARASARLRAIAALAPDAMDAARASDARARAGALRGPLDGVPLFAKSIYDVRGLPTDASNADWHARFPEPLTRDALEVARLRAAGAVILGQTAADDFAYRGEGRSSATGRVRNPYDAHDARTAGGSSAGAAVTVACAVAFGALGTDDGGSNRIPAQCCGVVGMKPTFGRVPRTGVLPTWPVLDTHGPLARSVEDAALVLAAIEGGDPSDPFSVLETWTVPSAPTQATLAGRRLGVVTAHVPRSQMTADAIALFDRALDDARAAGATLVEIEPPVTLQRYRAAFADAARDAGTPAPDARAPAATLRALWQYFAGRTPDPAAAMRRGYEAYRAFYDVLPPSVEDALLLTAGNPVDVPETRAFLDARARVVRTVVRAMDDARVDALIYPTMPFAAFGADGVWPDIRTPLGFGNWLGLPEVSVPAGLGRDGVPGLNLSFVGRPHADHPLLALALAFERQGRRFVPPPALD